jgi:hypothetical protein
MNDEEFSPVRIPECRYPNVHVRLVGRDGNCFAILGTVRNALAAAGVDAATRTEFMTEAMSGDYNHLLSVCMAWVEVE